MVLGSGLLNFFLFFFEILALFESSSGVHVLLLLAFQLGQMAYLIPLFSIRSSCIKYGLPDIPLCLFPAKLKGALEEQKMLIMDSLLTEHCV